MEIAEIPFWILMVLTLLPITLAILFMFRIITLIKNLVIRKSKSPLLILDIGHIMLFLIYFGVLINVVLFILGEQPSSFSIFDYLVNDMLPVTIYMILMYGILAQIGIAYRRIKAGY